MMALMYSMYDITAPPLAFLAIHGGSNSAENNIKAKILHDISQSTDFERV